MGIHSMNPLIKSTASPAEIEGKELTNHSAHKTLVKTLKAANQPRPAIIGVTYWPYKQALFSQLRRRRWEWTAADFLNHKLRRSSKQVQPTPISFLEPTCLLVSAKTKSLGGPCAWRWPKDTWALGTRLNQRRPHQNVGLSSAVETRWWWMKSSWWQSTISTAVKWSSTTSSAKSFPSRGAMFHR